MLVCGIGSAADEAAAREAALAAATREFQLLCDDSADCRNRDYNRKPLRNDCRRVTAAAPGSTPGPATVLCTRAFEYEILSVPRPGVDFQKAQDAVEKDIEAKRQALEDLERLRAREREREDLERKLAAARAGESVAAESDSGPGFFARAFERFSDSRSRFGMSFGMTELPAFYRGLADGPYRMGFVGEEVFTGGITQGKDAWLGWHWEILYVFAIMPATSSNAYTSTTLHGFEFSLGWPLHLGGYAEDSRVFTIMPVAGYQRLGTVGAAFAGGRARLELPVKGPRGIYGPGRGGGHWYFEGGIQKSLGPWGETTILGGTGFLWN